MSQIRMSTSGFVVLNAAVAEHPQAGYSVRAGRHRQAAQSTDWGRLGLEWCPQGDLLTSVLRRCVHRVWSAAQSWQSVTQPPGSQGYLRSAGA